MAGLHWIALIIALLVVLILPLGSALLLRRRVHIPLRMFFWAALFYLINLLLQIPLFILVGKLNIHGGTVIYALVSATIYGICEEVMRYLSFRSGKSMRTHRDHNGALMAGLGHGGTEAIILGLLPVINFAYAMIAPAAFNQGARAFGTTTNQFLVGAGVTLLTIALGRLFALIGHLGLATLSVMAYRVSWLFLPLVIITHIVFDASTFGIEALTGSQLWEFIVFGAWAVLALIFVIYIRRSNLIKPREPEVQLSSPTDVADTEPIM